MTVAINKRIVFGYKMNTKVVCTRVKKCESLGNKWELDENFCTSVYPGTRDMRIARNLIGSSIANANIHICERHNFLLLLYDLFSYRRIFYCCVTCVGTTPLSCYS